MKWKWILFCTPPPPLASLPILSYCSMRIFRGRILYLEKEEELNFLFLNTLGVVRDRLLVE
jgi:hypothetical protein